MLYRLRQFTNDDSGQILPLFAIMLVVLIGFATLAIDGGRVYQLKNKAYNIAEASALSASDYLSSETDKNKVKDTAIEYAVNNGAKENEVTVTTEYGVMDDKGNRVNKLTVGTNLSYTTTFAKFIGQGYRKVYGEYSLSVP